MPNSNDVFEQEGILDSLKSLEDTEEEEGGDTSPYFSYRIVLNEGPYGIEAGIYEIYFNDAGKVEGWIPSRSAFGFDEESIGKSVTELRDDLEMMLTAFDNETYSLMMDGDDEYLEVLD